MGAAVRALRSSIAFWETILLSVAGRIALLKMVALPQLLYFFGTLPLWIPRAIFRELDSIYTAFIWGSGRRRVALRTLQRPTADGGIAVPDFEAYYLAAQLQWFTQ